MNWNAWKTERRTERGRHLPPWWKTMTTMMRFMNLRYAHWLARKNIDCGHRVSCNSLFQKDLITVQFISLPNRYFIQSRQRRLILWSASHVVWRNVCRGPGAVQPRQYRTKWMKWTISMTTQGIKFKLLNHILLKSIALFFRFFLNTKYLHCTCKQVVYNNDSEGMGGGGKIYLAFFGDSNGIHVPVLNLS